VSCCIHVSTPHKPCKWVRRGRKSAAAVRCTSAAEGCTAAAVGCTAATADCTSAAGSVAGQCMAVRRHASGYNASFVQV
jgi:hypothetical protein